VKALERFLFAPLDPWHVRFFRIVLAAVLALVFWPQGTPPIPPVPPAAYWAVTGVAWALFLCGTAPRVTGFALALLLFPSAFQSGLQVSRPILLYTLIAFSFVRSGAERGPAWPIRLIQLELSVVYGVNALAKSTPQFLSGETLAALSLLPNFSVDLSGGRAQVGPFALPLWLAASAVVATEYGLAVGIWIPKLRTPVILLAIAFHLGLTQVVAIGRLHVATLFLYTSFLLPLVQSESPPERMVA
jgi:hypothetical protein